MVYRSEVPGVPGEGVYTKGTYLIIHKCGAETKFEGFHLYFGYRESFLEVSIFSVTCPENVHSIVNSLLLYVLIRALRPCVLHLRQIGRTILQVATLFLRPEDIFYVGSPGLGQNGTMAVGALY